MSFDALHPSPAASVGILTRNAGAAFGRVLESLLKQRTQWPFEIVVLDSASRDGTDAMASARRARVIPYRPKKFRFGAARDALFENCRGEVVVTISQDVAPANEDWLEKLVAPILEGRADATVGEQEPPPGAYTFYWDYHGSWLRSVAVGFDQAHGKVAISCADLALRRSTWARLRFGDVEAIEDRVMQVKLHHAGCRMLMVPEALSLHGHDYTWKELYNRLGSFAMGWAQLGWPYTSRRLVRDLMQPSRYIIAIDAFMKRRLVSWKEFVYPVAMCFIQWHGSRKNSGTNLKIGYIISSFPALSETFVVNDIRGLESLGHEVTAIALEGADPQTEGNSNYTIRGRTIRVRGLKLPVWRKVQKMAARQRLKRKYGETFGVMYERRPSDMPEELWVDRLTWDAALEQIDDEKCDFLYVHFAMRQLLLGYAASRMLDLPLAVTMQAHDIFVNPLAHLFPQLLGQCAFVVTVSEYNRREILRLAPNLDAQKVHVLANGIDVDFFRPKDGPWEPHHPFRFAGTGRLVEIKGFHVLVEAAGLLSKTRQDFVVQIVGEGPLRPALEQRISELNLQERFTLLGKRDATFLRGWLADQDCFTLPCVIAKDGNRDGMPLALREGMACGLPAISTQLLGLHETVSPGTGFLSVPDDPASLAADMLRMMSLGAEEYRTMAQAARRKAEAEFSLRHEVTMLQTWMEEELRVRRQSRLKAAV